ncbi:hypothetical protein BWQ96_09895 [Gracilariopsis chorda]|uniref:Uncharacterized protein n=1 Tax=Gracilariopsis chorda TaxID=448386 RepID=A0A2V3IEB0_9FLOR|nr:hypothetical protein BWQ96_09895 [Gracilariopsis chorda]|eukprot:PXF40403.1 hypothetical protein BWQ96_09895 [Gracilariopsis chorda]
MEHYYTDAEWERVKLYDRWYEFVLKLLRGDIKVGSRTPLRNIPAFLTLDVLQGGFASGRLAAGGPLLPFEIDIVENMCIGAPGGSSYEGKVKDLRKALNQYHLSPDGLRRLHTMLREGLYRVVYPEESALLVIVWMLERGEIESAKGLVSTIAPYFGEVRFYPQPCSTPVSLDLKCSILTVCAFKRGVSEMRVSKGSLSYAINKLIVEDLAPAYDGLISLVLSTCKPRSTNLLPFNGRPTSQMVAAFKDLSRRFENIQRVYDSFHLLAHRPRKQIKQLGESRYCGIMLKTARLFFESKSRPHSKSASRSIQHILLQIREESKRGLPSDDYIYRGASLENLPAKLKEFRLRQRRTTEADHQLVSHDWKKLSIARVDKMSSDENAGLDIIQPLLVPVSRLEEQEYGVKKGTPLLPVLSRMVQMLKRGTLEELFERKLIPSMEVLASLVDGMLGAAEAQWQGNTDFRRLYASTLSAFRHRRSLLLLNYESQVGFHELPWTHRLAEVRLESSGPSHREVSKLLCKLIRTCISRWPHVIIPNKILSALDHVAKNSSDESDRKRWIGLTPELAADIFMNGFVPKWCRHTLVAKDKLNGSLYDKYYSPRSGNSVWSSISFGTGTREELDIGLSQITLLCQRRASKRKLSNYVAKNGGVIEEAMILTGHNYPYLLEVLKYCGEAFNSEETLEICVRCFKSLKLMLNPALREDTPCQARLQISKNAAYGWRQMVILLSIMDSQDVDTFFSRTLSRSEAIGGCTLQRSLVDLRAVWKGIKKGIYTPRTWKPLYGWQSTGHGLWDKSWCERIKAKEEVLHEDKRRSIDSE